MFSVSFFSKTSSAWNWSAFLCPSVTFSLHAVYTWTSRCNRPFSDSITGPPPRSENEVTTWTPRAMGFVPTFPHMFLGAPRPAGMSISPEELYHRAKLALQQANLKEPKSEDMRITGDLQNLRMKAKQFVANISVWHHVREVVDLCGWSGRGFCLHKGPLPQMSYS